jgi:hypothetical protein
VSAGRAAHVTRLEVELDREGAVPHAERAEAEIVGKFPIVHRPFAYQKSAQYAADGCTWNHGTRGVCEAFA